ncbi:MAG: hypothetical protein J5594_01835 [Elusimicrobiaceae bacterium]|nr:hypothetical protein [Elusimicrobiaceae bacterium]
MKKTTLIACAVVALTCCACQTTEKTEKTNIDYSKISVQNVLDQSAQMRENVNSYKAAQQAADSQNVNTGKTVVNNIKDSAKTQYNEVKKQLKDERNAWKETLNK